jgi:hypothetical protein
MRKVSCDEEDYKPKSSAATSGSLYSCSLLGATPSGDKLRSYSTLSASPSASGSLYACSLSGATPVETSFTLAQNCWSMRSAANSGSVYSYFSNLSTANPPEETARTLTQLYQPYPQPQDHCMLALFQVQPPVETSFTLAQNCWSMRSAVNSGSVYYC